MGHTPRGSLVLCTDERVRSRLTTESTSLSFTCLSYRLSEKNLVCDCGGLPPDVFERGNRFSLNLRIRSEGPSEF